MFYNIVTGRSVVKLPAYISWYSGSRLRSSHMDGYSLVSAIQPRVYRVYRHNNSGSTRDTNNYDNDGLDQTASSFSKFTNNYFYRAVNSWNRLPLEIRTAENCQIFKNMLEKHLWKHFYEVSKDEDQTY